jgi:hypothetical protein
MYSLLFLARLYKIISRYFQHYHHVSPIAVTGTGALQGETSSEQQLLKANETL